jgi:hypothetical protein
MIVCAVAWPGSEIRCGIGAGTGTGTGFGVLGVPTLTTRSASCLQQQQVRTVPRPPIYLLRRPR